MLIGALPNREAVAVSGEAPMGGCCQRAQIA